MAEATQTAPTDRDIRSAIAVHASALTFFPTIIGAVVAPVALWRCNRHPSELVERAAREAISFNVSWLVWMCLALTIGLATGWYLGAVLAVCVWTVLVVWACIRTADGIDVHYPLTVRIF